MGPELHRVEAGSEGAGRGREPGVRMGPDAAQGKGTEPPVEPPENTALPRVSAG